MTVPYQTVAIHTSTIVCRGKAVLFLGESGTGKSTHTRLWRENIEEATIRSHMARDVIKQVRTVPEPYQTVFLLRIILEYDYKKIGECYGNSDVWARVVFYRAKNMLQKKLKEELHYEV